MAVTPAVLSPPPLLSDDEPLPVFAARFVDDVRELPEEVISVVIGVLEASFVLVTTTVTGVLDSPGVVPDAVTTDVIT